MGHRMSNYLTVREAAKATKMSEGWWRQRIFHKDVRFLKVGNKVLIPKSTIDSILSNAVVEPRADSEYATATMPCQA